MKLIHADVDHPGPSATLVEVKDGMAVTFAPARPGDRRLRGAQKQADEIRRAREPKRSRDPEHANEIKVRSRYWPGIALPVKISADSGSCSPGVTAADVVAAIKKAGGPNLDKADRSAAQDAHQGQGTHGVGAIPHPEIDVEVSLDVAQS